MKGGRDRNLEDVVGSFLVRSVLFRQKGLEG